MFDLFVTTKTAIVCLGICFILLSYILHYTRNGDKECGSENDLFSNNVSGIDQDPWLLRAPLLPLVIALVSALVGVYALVMRFAFEAENFQLPKEANVASPVTAAFTLVAGALTAAYAVLRIRAHLLAEAKGKLDALGNRRAETKHLLDQEAAFVERFGQAVRLLADEHSISRIAGVHLITGIGDEWKRKGAQQQCYDVLISHLRGLAQQNISFNNSDEDLPPYIREEIRLITSVIVTRLGACGTRWDISNPNFSDTILVDLDLTNIEMDTSLILRCATVLGSLHIPKEVCSQSLDLHSLQCFGDLVVESSTEWEYIDLSNSMISGSVLIYGSSQLAKVKADYIRVDGDFSFDFAFISGDIEMQSSEIAKSIIFGLGGTGIKFGLPGETPTLSLVDSVFDNLLLCNSSPGPQLDITDAVGSVDLSGSFFPLEVTANGLNASSGMKLDKVDFAGSLVLHNAILPEHCYPSGAKFSRKAYNGIESSEFNARELFLSIARSSILASTDSKDIQSINVEQQEFAWKDVLDLHGKSMDDSFISEVRRRLSGLNLDLPQDWQSSQSFSARVMSEISRAASISDVSDSERDTLKKAIRRLFNLTH